MRKFFAAVFLFLIFGGTLSAEELKNYPSGIPAKKFYDGEKLVYQIKYLGVPVGRGEAEIKKTADKQGRAAYLIEVNVKSNSVIDWIYKVRDEHRSWIDAETLGSLRYDKKIHEGRRKREESVEFDAAAKKAGYYGKDGKLVREVELAQSIMQDMLSCGYFARTLDFKPESSVVIPVHAQERNWNMEVKFFEKGPIDIKGVGRFEAVRAEPKMDFEGIFIRRGKIEGWISLDARRIPLKMKVKIPVLGTVTAELIEYQEGRE